ncbi:pentatricopeptide repeat-containing protein At3g04130, mitochondrial-like isoform X2 [Salvia splendens]|uniref:pentatricopeptide repeat-containing protein At3g04130, mitochondrial-like isoform X2 n=1 Tax=Salvia splendens TaxID=180675 RepID=UPI001C273EE8|nr:pentatricopeptide repeat-containing protein At3g04130, mitochondrial-like isoform X2 [Salvia splendens]
MVVRGRILAVFNSLPLFPSKARFAVVSRSFYGRLFTSDVPALDGYPLSGNLSSEQPEKCGDKKRNHDINVIINKVLNAQSESEVFHSLAQDIECNKIQITHSLATRLLHRFQDDWKSAIGVFRWVETCQGYKPLPEHYEKIVDVLGKMKQMEKMKELVGEICENHLISLNTIAKMMRRLAGAGEWKEAVKIFDELEKFGLEKNTESMNILLDTLCKEHKVEQARALFLELKSHIAPNANTYNIFIHGWCKIKRVEEAEWTIQEMKGRGFRPCVISYSTIIQFFCSQCKFYRVYELLDEMEVQGCPPNVVTFTTIMNSFTKSGYTDEALQVAEKMKVAGCKPDTQFYNALIHTLGRAGLIEEALNVFTKEMPNGRINPNTSTFNSMIAMFCHHKQEQRALEYLGILEQSPYCKPDVQSFYPLLKLYFRDGKTCKCLNLVDDVVKKHHLCLDLATYTLLIHGFCRGNKYERAYQLFKEMIGQNIKPRFVTCSLLLKEMREKNMYGAAEMIEDVMKKMKSPGQKNCSNPASKEV